MLINVSSFIITIRLYTVVVQLLFQLFDLMRDLLFLGLLVKVLFLKFQRLQSKLFDTILHVATVLLFKILFLARDRNYLGL